MRVYKVDSIGPIVDHLAETFSEQQAQGQRVLWLVSGGSAISIAVAVQKQLDPDSRMTVGLIDERYGVMGHAESNWTQLVAAGFDPSSFKPLPVLQNKSFEETARDYEIKLTATLRDCEYRIGLFGIGADGHTAGILPGSSAAESDRLVTYYEGPDYSRITTTPQLIRRLDEAVVYAAGEAKKPALSAFIRSDLPVSEQPVQALKAARKLTLYMDQADEGIPA